jgi:AraC-like DNA-binding protein
MTMLGPPPKAARPLDRGADLFDDAGTGLAEIGNYRAVLHSSPAMLVEDCAALPHSPPISGYDDRHQLVLPYHGLFGYCVGRRTWLVDSNQILFVTPGREYVDTHPVPSVGHAGLILNPSPDTLDELCEGTPPGRHPAFTLGTRIVSPDVRLLTHHLLKLPHGENPLRADECAVWLMASAVGARKNRQSEASRTVRLAKEMLHERVQDRLTLAEMAAEIGVSGPYLTQAFARSEGMPLYRYQTQLRLGRALRELPDCDSITNLALDLGFYCHSHFSYVFRKCFGLTPSKYRDAASCALPFTRLRRAEGSPR